jgi:hypothetical protein
MQGLLRGVFGFNASFAGATSKEILSIKEAEASKCSLYYSNVNAVTN